MVDPFMPVPPSIEVPPKQKFSYTLASTKPRVLPNAIVVQRQGKIGVIPKLAVIVVLVLLV